MNIQIADGPYFEAIYPRISFNVLVDGEKIHCSITTMGMLIIYGYRGNLKDGISLFEANPSLVLERVLKKIKRGDFDTGGTITISD